MKNLYLLLAIALLVAGCKKKDALVPVRVCVDDFTITQDDFPTREDPTGIGDYSGVKAITLAFYTAGGDEQYEFTQLRADASTYTTFGSFSLALPMGSYTMVVLGYGLNEGEPAITLTSPTSATFGDYPARETFAATQAVSIASTTSVEISATLSRIVSKLKVHSSDGCTANAVNVRTTFSAGGKAFNPTTGLATSNTGFSNVLPIQSSLGNSTNSISYLFLDTDEQTMTVTIDVLDGDGESISHKVVNNVPLQRNRLTTLTGSLYSAGAGTDFTINTSWLPETEVPF